MMIAIFILQKSYLTYPPLIIPQSSYNYFQTSKIEKKSKYQIQKKIIIVDKGTSKLNQFIRDMFAIDELEQSDQEIGQQEINKLLTRMKTSGYFYSINIKSKIIKRQQTVTIECQSMYPLKYINIKKNKHLIIPEKIIYNLFNQQIGKPQNFRLINEALKNIYKWYYEKGYQWVNIQVTQNDKQSIEIEINEGIINSIHFKFIGQTEESTTKNELILNTIRNFLDIKEKTRLNYNDIEAKLNELKQKQAFENCDYTVLKSKKKPQQLDLLFSIYELPDKTTFLVGKNTNFSPGIVETIESKIFNSINKLFKEIIYPHPQRLEKSFKPEEYLTNIKNKSNIQLDNYNSQRIINKILTQQHLFSLSDLYEWYSQPVHFINSNSLGVNYNIQNIGKQREYLKIRFKVPSVYKNLILTYCKPWIGLYSKQNSLIKFKFLRQSFFSNHKKVTDLLSQIFNHKFIFLDSLSKMQTLKAKLRIQINNNWSLKETFRLESIEQRRTSIKKRSEFLFSGENKNLKNLKINLQGFSYSNSHLVHSTHSNFISIDTKLKYKFSYNHDINWSKTGSNFMVLSKYSIPYYNQSTHKLTNHYKKFSQRTILKYTFYNNFDLKKTIKIFNHQFSFFDLEIGRLFGSSTFFPWNEKFEIKFPDYTIKDKSRIPNFPKLLYRSRFEYHLGTPLNHSAFLFCNYIYSGKRLVFYRNTDIFNTVAKTADNEQKNHRLNGGIGYQLKTSIHRLPPIRIELSISDRSEMTIYFRIIEVLSSTIVHKKT